ncbi:MAG TPA: DNA-3-methyladenine glycosylase [Candidatus Enterenecus stercoripullorum]|nr:DNA-3-methyladenine glycosylase [Candidatus Enterenecus stercoripullorum]
MLPREFFDRDTVEVARDLVGKYLVRRYDGHTLAVRLTETEAYVGRMDKACHAYNYRCTSRTKTLFAPPGTAYVYLIYGLHCCLNLVTEPEGEPAAVLIRGGQIRHNGAIIAENRFGCKEECLSAYQKKNLLNGPGKLCAALRIDRSLNGLPYGSGALFVCASLEEAGLPEWPEDRGPLGVKAGKRIGIDYAQEAADFPWRFYLENR